jgi:hypothetical protein
MSNVTDRMTIHEYREYIRTGIMPTAQTPVWPLDTPKRTAIERQAERKLQAQCEGILEQRGYVRLTGDNVERHIRTAKGWYGHLVEARKNPFMPDLFIFSAGAGKCLLVELKVASVYQPGQRELIEAGVWTEVRTGDRFWEVLDDWESGETDA